MTSLNICIYLTNMVNWDIYRTPEKDKVRKFWLNCRHIIYIYIHSVYIYLYRNHQKMAEVGHIPDSWQVNGLNRIDL